VQAFNGERWSFLQTIGDHARRLLALDDEERTDTEARHLAWSSTYACSVNELLLDPRGSELIDEETPNLRLALTRAISSDSLTALEIAASLMRHWILAERFTEAHTSSAAVLASEPRGDEAGLRAIVHCGAALTATLAEDYAAAVGELQSALASADAIADPATDANFRQMSSMVLILTGIDVQGGLESARGAVEQARVSGDRLGLAWALVSLTFAEGLCDRFDAALAAYEEFLSIPGAPELARLRTWAELAAAYAEVMVGSPARALAHAQTAVELEGEWPTMTHFMAVSQRIHALARLGRADDALADAARALARAVDSGAMMAIPAIEVGLAIAELVAGDTASAGARALRVAELPQLHTVALMREALGYVALAGGDGAGARAQAAALSEIARLTASRRQQAVADLIAGRAALADEPEQARELLHSSLSAAAELGLERSAADALEALALLAGLRGDGTRAGRLAGAVAMARDRLGYAPLDHASDELARTCVERDGAAAWESAWRDGQALSLREAIAYARRSRGRRVRTSTGWPGLTPAEQEVAALAATGISNPEIATRLFMSRSTVKMHLSSVYQKLEISNRTELARAIARPGPG